MKKTILMVILCFVVTPFSQSDSEIPVFDPTDILDINGVWSGGKIEFAGGYVRRLMEVSFEYLKDDNNFGICYSNLLARTAGGGLNTWQIDGVFRRIREKAIIEPVQVNVGTISLPDTLINEYAFSIIFLNDSVAFIPTPTFGRMYLKKLKK